jgi:DNA-binding CsgD family transcriptional regulator
VDPATWAAVTRALHLLTPRQRTVLELHAQGLTLAGLAHELGVTELGAWKLLRRAVANMRQIVRGEREPSSLDAVQDARAALQAELSREPTCREVKDRLALSGNRLCLEQVRRYVAELRRAESYTSKYHARVPVGERHVQVRAMLLDAGGDLTSKEVAARLGLHRVYARTVLREVRAELATTPTAAAA